MVQGSDSNDKEGVIELKVESEVCRMYWGTVHWSRETERSDL